jgi:hypothetical protein
MPIFRYCFVYTFSGICSGDFSSITFGGLAREEMWFSQSWWGCGCVGGAGMITDLWLWRLSIRGWLCQLGLCWVM